MLQLTQDGLMRYKIDFSILAVTHRRSLALFYGINRISPKTTRTKVVILQIMLVVNVIHEKFNRLL